MEKNKCLTSKICFLSLVSSLFYLFNISPLFAQNIEVTLEVNQAIDLGACPVELTFFGMISVKKAAEVEYEFIMHEGDSEKVIPGGTLNFTGPGKEKVSIKIQFGGLTDLTNKDKKYSGWVAIKVLTPEKVESNKAKFAIDCGSEADFQTTRLEKIFERPSIDFGLPVLSRNLCEIFIEG